MATLANSHMLSLWFSFLALVGVLLYFQRKTWGRTLATPFLWFVAGLAFTGIVYAVYEYEWFGATLEEPSASPGVDASMMFVSAYLMEYALSFSFVSIIPKLCRIYRVPSWHLPRVVFWGLAGTVLVRLIIMLSTTKLVQALDWLLYVFGAVVLYTAHVTLRPENDSDGKDTTATTKLLSRLLLRTRRIAKGDYDGSLYVLQNGRRLLTSTGVFAIAIVAHEFVFAFDSIALLSVSKTAFIVVTASIVATISQRSWFSVGGLEIIPFPRKATVVLLTLIGAKMLTYQHVNVSHSIWLGIVLALVCLGFVEAVWTAPHRVR